MTPAARQRVALCPLLAAMIVLLSARAIFAQAVDLPADYACNACHRKQGELWNDNIPVTDESHLADDIHWQKGLRCHDCHGGSPTIENHKNHRDDPTFRSLRKRENVPAFCGHCHSHAEFMQQHNPSARVDQETNYWESGHGKRLKASSQGENAVVDKSVATCIDCHGGHGILAVSNAKSPVYPTHVAETCSKCHASATSMAGRTYHDRPMGTEQYNQWRQSVHAQALLVKGDLSAPTCNDCHGTHGALPSGVGSVANACGTCHGKIAKLFAETRMKHKFEEVGLPGCAACHGTHEITHPHDELLGMESSAVCTRCHNPQNPQYGATFAGAETARAMRARLDELKEDIASAEAIVRQAERLGMEVRGPRFDLHQAVEALTNARTLMHSFKPGPLEESLAEGLKVTAEVKERGDAALREHTNRRIWLAASLAPILVVVALLVFHIRTLPLTSQAQTHQAGVAAPQSPDAMAR